MEEFKDRRKPVHSIEDSVRELKDEFVKFSAAVEGDLKDQAQLIQNSIEHAAALQNFMLESQRQMQAGLQRQLDQNDQQHREIITVVKEELVKERQIQNDLMYTIRDNQAIINDKVEARIAAAEARIEVIERAKDRKGSERWNNVKMIFIGAVAAAAIGGMITAVQWLIQLPYLNKTPVEIIKSDINEGDK